jgi:hypothetical protein
MMRPKNPPDMMKAKVAALPKCFYRDYLFKLRGGQVVAGYQYVASSIILRPIASRSFGII